MGAHPAPVDRQVPHHHLWVSARLTTPCHPTPTRNPPMSTASPEPAPSSAPPDHAPRISADWAAVIVAAVLGLLPSIPFLVK